MKNRCKSAEEVKAEHLPFVAAVFSTPEISQRGFDGRAPDTAAILQLFIQKIRILGIFWSIFLLKMRF